MQRPEKSKHWSYCHKSTDRLHSHFIFKNNDIINHLQVSFDQMWSSIFIPQSPVFIHKQNARHHGQFRSLLLYSCGVFQVIINSFCFWKILLFSSVHWENYGVMIWSWSYQHLQHWAQSRALFLLNNIIIMSTPFKHPFKHYCVRSLLNITVSTAF